MLLGSDLENMSDQELAKAAETTDDFCKADTGSESESGVCISCKMAIQSALWEMVLTMLRQ